MVYKTKKGKQQTKFTNNNPIQCNNNGNSYFINHDNQYQTENQICYYQNQNGFDKKYNK